MARAGAGYGDTLRSGAGLLSSNWGKLLNNKEGGAPPSPINVSGGVGGSTRACAGGLATAANQDIP